MAELEGAFRELHGARLHGFALLLSLGDRELASGLAGDALTAALPRLHELRHPERAAAWLRARVVRQAGRRLRPRASVAERDAVLAGMGVQEPLASALGRLDTLERAALIVAVVERLDGRDVATVVGRSGRSLSRLLRRARVTYVDAFTGAPAVTASRGPVGEHLDGVAAQAMH